MTKLLPRSLGFISLLAISLAVHAAEYSYLSDAVNQINRIYTESPTLSPKQRAQIFAISCAALETLQEDLNFKERTKDLLSDSFQKDRDAIIEAQRDVSKLNQFLQKEYAALKGEGFSPSAQVNILSTGLARAKSGLPLADINVDGILTNISVLRAAACSAKEEARDAYRTAVLVYGMYGVSLIAVDGIAGYFSGGTIAYLASVSGGIGGAMIMDAARDF